MKYIYIILGLFFLVGCTEPEKIAITIVFDQPLEEGNYPAYFKDLVMPFNSDECETEFLLKPINFVRADIRKSEVESNAWYFEEIGDNTVEFSAAFLEQYFRDSITPSFLNQKKGTKTLSYKSYTKNENALTLIYSEESDLEEFEGIPILNTSAEIHAKIKENSCTNSARKVFVIVNPEELNDNIQIDRDPVGEGLPLKIANPCNTSTISDGLNLKDDLVKIIDTKKNYKERDQLAKTTWSTYFDEMAAVNMYLKPNQKYPEGTWESGDGQNYFIDRLAYMNSITDINITRIEYHRETKKITGITIVECHNASQLQ